MVNIFEKIEIIYEDDNLLVLNKPAGLSVHGDGRSTEPTVVDWLVERYPEIKDVGEPLLLPDGTSVEKSGIVHRLDKDTSGILLVAKKQETFLHLKRQFSERKIKKTYRLIVAGEIRLREDERERVIRLPIGRSKKDARIRVASRKADGQLREAVTYYRVIENFKDFAYVEAHPETGRTHQLRAHFKAIHHPIVCDRLYGTGGICPVGLGRQALHAFKVEFFEAGGRQLRFEAPLPEDMQAAIASLSEG